MNKMKINEKAFLVDNLFDRAKIQQVPTRNGYGEGLVIAGDEDKNIVALCADLVESTRTLAFKQKYPDRYIEMGVAEQNLATIASGLSAVGKIPFISSYGMFSPGRNWEQIRTTICYNEQNVKIIGAHTGVSVGPDGGTHQAVEDIAITRVIPNMVVLSPCDAIEARKAVLAALELGKPVYLRLAREKTPVMTTDNSPFEIGKAEVFWEPEGGAAEVGIVATGALVHRALLAAQKLGEKGIRAKVLNFHTIKPIDADALVSLAKETGAIVTVEEHQIAGGFGSAVAEVLAANAPVPIEFIGVQNRFGQSGKPDELIELYGMGEKSIIEAAEKVVSRK